MDNNGCQQEFHYTINENSGILVDVTIINESCPDASDGSISLTVSGGQEPYTFHGPHRAVQIWK